MGGYKRHSLLLQRCVISYYVYGRRRWRYRFRGERLYKKIYNEDWAEVGAIRTGIR